MVMLALARKLIFSCAILCLLGSTAYAQQPELAAHDLVGMYTDGGGFGGSTITIEPKGRYHTDSSDCTQSYYEAGTYTFKAGALYFTVSKRTVRSHGQNDEKNLLDPKVYKKLYHEDPPADDRTDELIPVKWGERLYLMRKESLLEFCNAINLGLEPRRALGHDWYLGAFYLRNGDEAKTPNGRPSLPDNLLALLLEKPVEAEIINIERDGKGPAVAIINKGEEAGLKPGMRLVMSEQQPFADGPTLWDGLEIISVTYGYARLTLREEAQLGDKVSSKFTPHDDQ